MKATERTIAFSMLSGKRTQFIIQYFMITKCGGGKKAREWAQQQDLKKFFKKGQEENILEMPRELHEFGPPDTECQFSGRHVPGAGNTEGQRRVSGLGVFLLWVITPITNLLLTLHIFYPVPHHQHTHFNSILNFSKVSRKMVHAELAASLFEDPRCHARFEIGMSCPAICSWKVTNSMSGSVSYPGSVAM